MNLVAFRSAVFVVSAAAALAGCCHPRNPDARMASGCMTMPGIYGVVRATDPPSDHWIVSAGRLEEVKPAFEFTVYRGSEYVATLVIDEVREHESTGHSKPGMQKRPILVGDECAARL